MAEKNFNNVRIVNKHDTEANWLKATGFTPKQGELIVYDIDENYSYERIKIGDGVQNVNTLPFYAGNWEDLAGKPFWSEGPTTVEWDGNTDGLTVSSDGTAYRVSDLKPSSTEVIGGKLTFRNGSVVEITQDMVEGTGYITSIYYGTVYINNSNGSAYDYSLSVTLSEPGIYFQKNTYDQIVSFSYGNETVHCLDEKFIPDTIARVSDIQEQISVDSELSSTSTNPVQNKVVNEAINNISTLVGDTAVSEQISEATQGFVVDLSRSGKYLTYTFANGGSGSVGMIGKAGSSTDSEIFNDYTNNSAVGKYSHVEGYKNATGNYAAHAEGGETKANGQYSHSEGYGTTADEDCSHAEGSVTVASGNASHAEGQGSVASGQCAHAEGYNATAMGNSSHAEGRGSNDVPTDITISTSNDVIIDAWETTKFNLAKDDQCHTEGNNTLALDSCDHAEGYQTIASGGYSHSEGYQTKALRIATHAEGYNTTANGAYSHVEGVGTLASGANQHVQGKYNIEDAASDYAHIVGNGTSSERSNAHTLDWDGNAWFAGDVYVGGTGQDDGEKLVKQSELPTETVIDATLANSGQAADAKATGDAIGAVSDLVGDISVSAQISEAIANKADVSMLPNVNLLDNWYFADPVNSQGLTTYPSGTYAIDRWFMRTSQGNIVDGGFQVNNVDGISFYGITQALNNPTQYCGKTVTFSAKFTEINTASAVEMKIASSTQVAGVGTVVNEIKNITAPGIYSVTATIPDTLPSTTLAVWITCRDATVGANYVIESVKLEFGSVSTLAADPVPNKADQVARCSNYDSSGAFLDTLFATQAFVLKYVPKIASITLKADYWTFSSNAYYQDVALSCATTTSKVDLQPTYYQLAEWQSDGLAFSTVSQNGVVRVWVTDVAPKEDITIQVTVQEVLEV